MSVDLLAEIKKRDEELRRIRAAHPQDERSERVRALLDAEAERSKQLASDPEYLAELQRESEAKARELAAFKESLWRRKVYDTVPARVRRNAFNPKRDGFPAVAAVERWLEKGCSHDLVIRGGVGVGKSTAACVAVKHWLEPKAFISDSGEPREAIETMRTQVSWLRPDQLVSAIKHSYDEKAPKLHRFVVIEDLGCETKSDFVDAFTELLDSDEHVLLITTNMKKTNQNPPGMRERYDERILDRLRERAEAFDVPGESKRRKNDSF